MPRRVGAVLLCAAAAAPAAGGAGCAGAASAGDISSVFSSLLGETYEWPARFAALKAALRPPPAALRRAWDSLDAALSRELAELRRAGAGAVPAVACDELLRGAGTAAAARMRKAGVVVVRGVVPEHVARGWKEDVLAYAAANPGHTGYPADDPQVLELYWSRAQLQARQHERVHATTVALNKLLWSAEAAGGGASDVDLDRAYTYGERLRIRRRGDRSFNLGPHIDGGSIERFEDPFYRDTYARVFSGEWEKYDPWRAGSRARANCSMYTAAPNGAATIFRAFQGWLAVSAIGPVPGAGTLRVLPLVQHTTAYLLLRPFLDDVAPRDFCGAIPGKSQDLMRKFHARIYDALVPIPAMRPGDMVFWHPDVVHAVEEVNNGEEDSSVFYIPSMPGTEVNARYVERQAGNFLRGRTPPDFPPNDSEEGFVGRGSVGDLTPLGRRMLGVAPDSGEPEGGAVL